MHSVGTWAGGMYVPDSMSVTVEESAVQGIASDSGGWANGVFLACPK